MHIRQLLILLVILSILASLPADAARGISLNLKTPTGMTEQIPLYNESHALLVGVADYSNGWPDLPSIGGELDQLEAALVQQGFQVEKVLNPDRDQLASAYEKFIDRYGFDRDSRLLFFFSGHGFSRTNAGKGYIVPADAPSPLNDERGFLRKAIEMEQMLTWARRIESKHALFLFDSCFSGTVFQSRALPKEPPHISAMVARPVRQFISAGSAGEEVPSRSYFVPSFIRAIEGEGDLDKDGYVTGTELGMYLNRQVTGYRVGQTPQYGKIRDPELDQGDFVMMATPVTHMDVAPPVASSADSDAEARREVERLAREKAELERRHDAQKLSAKDLSGTWVATWDNNNQIYIYETGERSFSGKYINIANDAVFEGKISDNSVIVRQLYGNGRLYGTYSFMAIGKDTLRGSLADYAQTYNNVVWKKK